MFNLCSVCVIALLVLSASRADEDAAADDEGLAANPVSAELGAVRSVCKPVPNTTGLCSGIGYGEMRLPNLLGHASAREAQQQSAAWMPLLGSVMCEVCSPDSEGQQKIQQNFCKSQFAFRLRIGSWSGLGTDVCVVLRWVGVFRWLGGPLEQSALWLPRGCPCPALEGQLKGSYIALSHTQNGRVLLRRLLRWSRDEKELKKFIRMLLRQDC